ncbi:transposase [Dyadobacter psychrotolerans]|uniref:Transposase n=1 Tax=Dyadobacter psychrotolerans TaxID=2541721 RepID=A0A4V6PFN8_9BACT|nr:transposase [Dyadobacter psychrotolerans]TDE10808.1 transposase [Dyadobacter psychrotolerans]
MQRVLQRQSNILKETFRLFNNQESINTEKRQIKQREELQRSQVFPLSNKNASLFTGNVSAQRQFKFEMAKDLYAKGYKIKTISKHLNANIKSIRKYVNLEVLPSQVVSHGLTNFDMYRAYLIENNRPGVTYKDLYHNIVRDGFNGKYTSFCDRMNRLMTANNSLYMNGTADQWPVKLPTMKTWSTTKLAFMALGDTEKLKPDDKKFLEFLYQSSSVIRATAELAIQFKKLFLVKQIGSLDHRLQNALKPNSGFKGFARGIESDYEAVNQAVISNVSNGPVEGQVNKLKTIKRNMYGRASFDLLKIMVLGNT